MSIAAVLLVALSTRVTPPPIPDGWPEPHYRFEQNAPTAAGFELGRRLFHDPRLSADGAVSCASCHQQAAAFAHARHRVSHGVADQLGTRNAPALFNLAWQPDFMWDGAVTHLELQPLAPLTNALEMGSRLPDVLARLR
ncbi:MAG: cytochrome-c peroxidase, partial [Panacagrimonas sp.]